MSRRRRSQARLQPTPPKASQPSSQQPTQLGVVVTPEEARWLRDNYKAGNLTDMARRAQRVQLAQPKSSAAGVASQQGSFQGSFQSMPTQYQQQSSANWPGKVGNLTQYPSMPDIPDNKPFLPSLGATGTAIFSGIIYDNGEYNPDFYWRDGLEIYERMRRNDAQIRAVIKMMELPLRRATWSIEPFSDDPRDVEIASFVESCLFHDMRYTTTEGRVESQSWDDILRHILLMLTFGFSVFEQVWRIEDGWVKWARWTPLLPKTIWRWWVGEDNELVGVQQWTFKNYGYVFVDIPADKLILFSYDREGNNYAGISPLRSAYKHWYYKEQYEKIDAIGIERNAVVPAIVKLPPNYTENDVAAGQQIVQNLRVNEQMGVTLPPGWELEYPKNEQKYASNVMASIQYHDIMIARNMLAQFLNLGSTETGAYALADSQIRTFLQAEQAIAEQIEGTVNGEPIKRLVDYNYSNAKGYPKIKCSKVALSDATDLAKSLGELVNMPTPLIHPDNDLEDFLRDQFGLPKAARGEVQGTNPTAPSDPARPENQNANDHSDQQPQDKDPTDAQQAQSQAKASGIAADPDTAKGQLQGQQGAKTAMETLAWETRLLREATAAISVLTDHDAVAAAEAWRERPADRMAFSNPYPQQKGGRFGPGPGKVEGGAGAAKGGATKAAGGVKTSATPKAKTGAGGGGGSSSASEALLPSDLREIREAKGLVEVYALQESVAAKIAQSESYLRTMAGNPHADIEGVQRMLARQQAMAKAIAAKADKLHAQFRKQGYLVTARSKHNGFHRIEVVHSDGRITQHSYKVGQYTAAEAKARAISDTGLTVTSTKKAGA